MQEIFNSKRYFLLFDYKASHGKLLLRSQKDNNNNNIDIVFYNTIYLQLECKMKGIKISIDNSKTTSKEFLKEFLNFKNNNLFVLESNGQVYTIAASFVRIYENDLDFTESSLLKINKGVEIASTCKDQ